MTPLTSYFAILVSAIAFIPASFAADGDDASKKICEDVLSKDKGKIVVRHDGLSKEYAVTGLNDAIEARDVLHKLGVPTPPHQIIFAPERQLNILTATGVLPMPHAISGADIYKAMADGSTLGVLEFAWPGGQPGSFQGCSTCRSYYSNMTTTRDQRPIYLHVGGHNHIFQRSILMQKRNIDPIAASEQLANELETQYERHGFEPVSLFYHYLHATVQLQDFVDGTYSNPSELTPKASEAVEVETKQAVGAWNFLNPKTKSKRAPWEKTPSVLQFMTANLPVHITPYKRDLLEKFELTNRVYPAIGAQKFVHEGWATFLMMLGQKHSNWTSDRDVFDFARIIQGVVGKQIRVDHPYSFGVAGFNHLYAKFKRQPEMQDKSEGAVDVLFVQHIDKLVQTMTDADFVHRVVDDEFVNFHKLSLVRKGSDEELMPVWQELHSKGVPQDKWPKGVVISNSTDRIRRALVRRIGKKNSPLMQAINPALISPFQINMEQRVVEHAPLEPVSAAQVFFAQTQVSELPVSAVFLLSDRWLNPASDAVPGTVPARIEVRPDGRVRIFQRNTMNILEKKPIEEELTALSAHLQTAVDFYKTDQSFSFSDKVLEEDQKRWEQMFPKMIEDEVAKANVQGIAGLVDYAPAAARAIMLFSKLVKARFAKQMEAAFQGKMKLKFGPTGVKLPLIPMTPHLQYDRKHQQKVSGQQPPAPMDTMKQRLVGLAISHDADDGSLIGPVGGSVGDPRHIPPGGGGKGKGSGEEVGEKEEDNSIEIPIELFRRLLAMHFKIPNPRESEGEIPMTKEIKMGERRDSSEEPLWDKMIADALVKGVVARRAKGEKSIVGKVSPATLIREGFAKLDEDDYIIRSKREVDIPSFDAVVVVNVDLSGSMKGHRLELVKNYIFNVRELFRAVYPQVVFKYVGFNDEAEEYPESKIWTTFRSGSTAYAAPAKLTREILKKFPTGRWNQYVLFAGDAEVGDTPEFMVEFEALQKNLQYFGLIITQDPGTPDGTDPNGLREALRSYRQKWKWIGITQINDQPEIFRSLGDLFPKDGKTFKD